MMDEKKSRELDLVLNAQKGDEEAFHLLYEQYHRLVYFIANEMCQNDADAKDITQNTFLQVHKYIGNLQDPAHFRAWLNRIVINQCKNHFRIRKTVGLDEENVWFTKQMIENRSYMLPQKNTHYHSDQAVIYELLQRLPEVQRMVLILRFVEGFSMKEIASALEIPEGTVKSRLLYGKASLKKLIAQYEETNQIKLDFKFTQAAFLAAFGIAYEMKDILTTTQLHWLKRKTLSFSNSSNLFTPLLIVSSAIVLVGAGVLASQSNEADVKEYPSSSLRAEVINENDTKAKEQYFKLMDWACCQEEMMLKTQKDFETVMPFVTSLRNGNSNYGKRLETDNWFSEFDDLYTSF